ncbi:hypothetical protein HDU91_005345 [Kappamyces sp. JEL0680]|nr:hypothetical protein HDU91_005345 [Kappamyces sp. JEL0680]
MRGLLAMGLALGTTAQTLQMPPAQDLLQETPLASPPSLAGMCRSTNRFPSPAIASKCGGDRLVSVDVSKLNFGGGTSKMTNGIGSWYAASSGRDSTNGHSWCRFPYKDYSNGFAPSLRAMGNNDAGRNAYCGLEAVVKINGVEKTMYIIDAFDDRWVITPGSIDIMAHAWEGFSSMKATNKADVYRNVEWRLTGRRNLKYRNNGPGDTC